MNKNFLYSGLFIIQLIFCLSCSPLWAAVNAENNATREAVSLLLLRSCKPDLAGVLDPPVYEDPANIPVLTGSAYGAMGYHPVKAITFDNPGYTDPIINKESKNTGYFTVDEDPLRLKVTMLYPADLCTPRPTVFFIAGWRNYHYQQFYSLLYFIASHGYNAVFVSADDWKVTEDTHITGILRGIVADPLCADRIDSTRVGFMGHSIAGGLLFHLEQQLREWGEKGRFIFTLAGWTAYNQNAIPYQMAANTRLIIQTYNEEQNDRIPDHDDTDLRFSLDYLTSTSTGYSDKTYLYLPGDAQHISNHSTPKSRFNKNGQQHFYYDALQQVGIFRPLQSIMEFCLDGVSAHKDIGLPDSDPTLQTVNTIRYYSGDNPYLDLGRKGNPYYASSQYGFPFNKNSNGSIYSDVTIATDKLVYAANEAITIHLEKMAENANDWVGIFPAGKSLEWIDANGNQIKWKYTGGINSGPLTFINDLAAGDYVAAAFFNDSVNKVEAKVAFSVSAQ